jgi:3D (Asp-Asp-Asp) domain-containing protein
MKVFLILPVFILIATILLPLVVFNFNVAVDEFPVVGIYDSGQTYQYETAAKNVGEFLSDVGITVTDLDRVNYPMDSPLYDGMNIVFNRAVRFYVVTDDNPQHVQTVRYGTRVGEVLTRVQEELGVALLYAGDLGRVINYQDVLRFSSWRNRLYTETVEIPYEIIENYTGAVRDGRTYIRQQGAPGEHEITVNVVYIGGLESSRTITEKVVLLEPTHAVFDIGTARLGALTNTNAPDFHYVRRVRLHATAYCACFDCTGKHPGDQWFGVTASGRMVEHGIVAVDRNVIPLGTHLYVEGYGFAIAADVGGAITGYSIDLFMESHAAALNFGRRNVNVWILG